MEVPIACQTSVLSAEERTRYAALRARIDTAVTSIVETDRGYEFQLPGDDSTLAVVSDWIALERRCCPFLEFTVSIGASESSIRVALTGSPEVKRFLGEELRSRIVSPTSLMRRKGSGTT